MDKAKNVPSYNDGHEPYEMVIVDLKLPMGLYAETSRLVVSFAEAMAKKFRDAQQKYGYDSSWVNADEAWHQECRELLRSAVLKGDPVDVANYSALLWVHGESTAFNRKPKQTHS